ncbi:SGNH/GDSL hydrolase family protein [Methylophilus sp.]|uniref:SGNH/GDSL hydrolase family protein n=1 Tax=Methylophilus sp. TaxID=29541 RepID=UPI004035400C
MQHILVYSDSLSWGIIPDTRQRLPFEQRWPGAMEIALSQQGRAVRVIEDCLNGRRTVFEDPFKPGRNGQQSLAQRIEIHSPLSLVILMLGSNDFQSMHAHTAWHASQGIASLVHSIRSAPIEPGMPVPPILVIAPPPILPPKGLIAPKFKGAEAKCTGLADAYAAVCRQLDCAFFDAGSVVSASHIDGVHLDADQHSVLGLEMARKVNAFLPE